ncbi:MAG TPA: alpha-ketoacid dehydrogenase subunit beta [Acidobacteriaceae bacterium]|jgi:2-oxoisovalerate dehydrogenase E1 component beta subunit|nr:alpha-ketoacid dehydrogenase subunit beta [Acidobacteriaceae bacterium]
MSVSYIEAITTGLAEEMRRDDRVFLIGEDVGVMGGVFGATKGLFEEFGAERVIDSPLAEGVIVSSAIGASMAGLRPVAEIQFADFITPAMDAITQQAAKLRYRSGGSQTCPLTLRVCYGGGTGGGLYHSQTNTTWFAHEPGLIVVAPATVADAKGMLKAGIRQDDPVIYFEHKRLYRLPTIKEDLPEGDDFVTDLFHAAVRHEGKDATIVTYGYMLQISLQAAQKVEQETGASIEVIDLRVLNPLDRDTVLDSVAKTSRLCIVQEDHRTLGIGSEIAAIVAEDAFDCLDAPILRVAAPDVPAIPAAEPMEQFYMPNVDKVTAALHKLLQY